MRFYSKRYKSGMSKHQRKANAARFSLNDYIQTLTAISEMKASQRERRKHGEVLMWEEVIFRRFGTSIPLYSGRGKPLKCSVMCRSVDKFEQLEKEYGPCPEPIKARLFLKMKADN